MKILISIISLLLCLSLSAQNAKKGFKSLEKGEHEKAKEIFEKSLSANKNDVAANFGMAMILADDKSKYFDIIEAWAYILNVQGKTSALSQEEIEYIGEYFSNTEVRRTSRPVKKKIAIAIEAVEDRLIKYVREENKLEAVYAVLDKYPDFKYYDNVIHIRNQFEYRKYEKINTLAGFEEFISKFPDAAQVPKAENHRNRLAFEDIKDKDQVAAYNKYILDYPNSEYVQAAIKLRNAAAFAEAKRVHTLAAYNDFVEQYPNALEINEAKKFQKQLMYEKAKQVRSIAAYNEFIRKYPEGMYYIDVFNLKSEELGSQYINKLQIGTENLRWARGFDNNEQIESARSVCATNDGGTVIAGIVAESDTAYSDAWIIKVGEDGKMIWNKTIGQAYDDEIYKALCTSNNEIIVLGYTFVSDDSLAVPMGWMFKLGADGKKIWNKNLGYLRIHAAEITMDDKIYLSTFNAKDTLPQNYQFEVYNQKGLKVAEKKYVQFGQINDFSFSKAGVNFIAGSNWHFAADAKMYINWEDTIPRPKQTDHVSNNETEVVYCFEDSTLYGAIKYKLNGEVVWSKKYAKAHSTEKTLTFELMSDGNLVWLQRLNGKDRLIVLDPNGKLLVQREFYDGVQLIGATESSDGGVSYLLSNKDFLLLKFSNSSSL